MYCNGPRHNSKPNPTNNNALDTANAYYSKHPGKSSTISNNVPNETTAHYVPAKLPAIPPIYGTSQLVPNEPPLEVQHTTRRVCNKHHKTKTTKPDRHIIPGQENSKHSRDTKTQIILMYTERT